jgi:7,8-dihydropterin-6-yl-methyl-4-(beta-D-ribofuranosyl)aminobenzene 5'-phosphate synthase
MAPGLRITVLAENRSVRRDLVSEHGLSLWVEARGIRFLFDTGQGGAFFTNAERLGVALDGEYSLALSHGHYDHTGGMGLLRGQFRPERVFLHPAAILSRYACREGRRARAIGMPSASVAALDRARDQVAWTSAPTWLAEGAGLTGPIPRRTPFEDVGGPFFLDPECHTPDLIEDDQAAWVTTRSGTVVLLGCAHAGVVNTLDCLTRMPGVSRFRAVIGGMHLAGAGRERLERTAEALGRYGVELVAPCHCTGERAGEFLATHCSARFVRVAAGTVLEF